MALINYHISPDELHSVAKPRQTNSYNYGCLLNDLFKLFESNLHFDFQQYTKINVTLVILLV